MKAKLKQIRLIRKECNSVDSYIYCYIATVLSIFAQKSYVLRIKNFRTQFTVEKHCTQTRKISKLNHSVALNMNLFNQHCRFIMRTETF